MTLRTYGRYPALLFASLCLLPGLLLAGQDVNRTPASPAPPAKKTYTMARVDALPPVIDGRLDDAA